MTNKIPQEIEESLTAHNIYNEFELKAGIHIGTEERLIIQAIQKGFQAGQKQEREDVLKLIDDISRLYEDQEIVYVAEIKRLLKAGSKDDK